MERVLEHDTIILATPVYWYTPSAYMKMFIDRLTDCISTRKDIGEALKGKKVYMIGTYGNEHSEDFFRPIEKTCIYLGMHFGGCFVYYMGEDAAKKAGNDDLDAFWAKVIK